MVLVNLKGGLGNQMFQYALGRKLSLSNDDTLAFDISGLRPKGEDTPRSFALDAFTIEATIAAPQQAVRVRYPYGTVSVILEKIRSKILRQHHIGFEPTILRKTGTIYLDGYWQSPKYFDDIRETLLNDFTFSRPLSDAAKTYANSISQNAVSLHVRRGDYVFNPKVAKMYGSCSPEYYNRAIAYISERVPNPQWFIFSDDIAWVQKHVQFPASSVFVTDDGLTDVEELWLMSTCAHNVVANSSFSWWGAWLNTNQEKIVIAPAPWFDYDPAFTNTIVPTSWITIPKQ